VGGDDWVVVYRGYSVPALDLVQAMLHAEGFSPRRLGKASPALLGIGNSAVEQLIEVPRAHEQAALALIAASAQGSSDAAQAEELEEQALSAPPEPSSPAAQERGGFSPPMIALIVVVVTLLFLWSR
jgi:hypothetical protein